VWKRQALIVIAFVLAIRLPFLTQPIQGDDIYYLFGAQHAQIEPLHPKHTAYAFQGDVVSMRGIWARFWRSRKMSARCRFTRPI
jgi:hypothetical protein